MPKLSLGSWAFAFGPFASAPWSFARVLDFAAAAGYDGIEINGFPPHPDQDAFDTPEKCRALSSAIAARGLGVSGFAPAFAATPPAEVDTAAYLRRFERCLRFCDRCSIRTLRVDTVTSPAPVDPRLHAERFARLVAAWTAASRAAARSGIEVVWEFEPGFWLNRPSEVLRLVEAVAQPNFGVLFDTSHAYMCSVVGARQGAAPEILPEGAPELARMLRSHIRHLHLIDSDGTLHDGETSTHARFGAGKIAFDAVLAALRPGIDALPWWCVDLCFNADAEAAARESAEVVRRWLPAAP